MGTSEQAKPRSNRVAVRAESLGNCLLKNAKTQFVFLENVVLLLLFEAEKKVIKQPNKLK